MSAPRHRIVRPDSVPSSPPPDSQHQFQIEKARRRLAQQRAALARWMRRLRRAFHAAEKHQRASARLERQLRLLEEE